MNASSPSGRKDTVIILERIPEARVARHGLPAGLMTRLKDSVKTWKGQLPEGIGQAFWRLRGLRTFRFWFYLTSAQNRRRMRCLIST